VSHLLLVAAYRDDELTPGHPLALGLESIRKSGGAVVEIGVPPLTLIEVAAILADALHRDAAQVAELAALVQEKTGGPIPLLHHPIPPDARERGSLEVRPARARVEVGRGADPGEGNTRTTSES